MNRPWDLVSLGLDFKALPANPEGPSTKCDEGSGFRYRDFTISFGPSTPYLRPWPLWVKETYLLKASLESM